MDLLIGEYRNTLDEKGRILFPAKLRGILQKNELIVTKGLDHCLMLFTSEEWASLSDKIMKKASPFNDQTNKVIRRFIAPAQQLDFDRSGRLSIPQSLREYASLSGESVILGLNRYMELWDSKCYDEYLASTEADFKDAAGSMSDIFL